MPMRLQELQRICDLSYIQAGKVQALIEQRERKAFEAGWKASESWCRDGGPFKDEAFSAYQAAQEKAQ